MERTGTDAAKRIQLGLSRIRGEGSRDAGAIADGGACLDMNETFFTPYSMNREYRSKNFGDTAYLEVPACMHRCAWCYVDPLNLGGHVHSDLAREYRQKKADAGDLPKELVRDPTISADDTFSHYLRMHGRKPLDAVCIGSSEPLVYLPAIKRFSELVKEHGIPFIVGIDSTGFQLSRSPALVKELSGLEDVIHFVIATFKGRNPTEHVRATTSSEASWRAGIEAQDLLLRNGFWTIPAGITLNTFAHPNPKTLEQAKRIDSGFVRSGRFTTAFREYLAETTAEWLHGQLAAVHPDYPRLLHYNKITYGRVSAPEHQIRQMRNAGFVDCRPRMLESALKRVFAQRGTPIIEYDREQCSTTHPEYGDVMRQVIATKKTTAREQRTAPKSGVPL